MPHNHAVHLNVRNQPSNGNDGYTDTTASNNAIYSYKYTGGDNGRGDISETVGLGSATIDVDVAGGPNYQITGITFVNDTYNQLSWSGGGGSAAVIDANTQVENASYCTSVTDTNANCSFNCDPMIDNTRNPPMAM